MAAALSVSIAVLAVRLISVKAAMSNPVSHCETNK